MKRFLILASVILTITGCERNHAPVVGSILCAPEKRNAGTLFTLTATASDEDGDLLTYSWSCEAGEFPDGNTGFQTKWKSPLDGTGKSFAVEVTVSDGKDSVSSVYTLSLTEVLYGNVEGNTSFQGTLIMIPGVTIAVGGQTTVSDENGHFSLSKVPVGKYTLTATKELFGVATRSVTVNENSLTHIEIGMVSAHLAGKISGYVKDQDSLPVSGATVVLMNPDQQESTLQAITSSTGSYQIQGIPLGTRIIRIRKAANEEFRYYTLDLQYNMTEVQQTFNVALNGEFTDRRTKRTYRTRIIGYQTWMAENLDYLPKVYPHTDRSATEPRYYVYGFEGEDTATAKDLSNYRNYGVLYNLEAALVACPAGWHLPSDEEFATLAAYLGANPGQKMKSVSGWLNGGNGNNSSGFAGLPAGSVGSAGFGGMGEWANFWTTSTSGNYYLHRSLSSESNQLPRYGFNGTAGYSVRCIKDE
jgi:uncharacterized protein (TIGR02145 family)